MTDIETKHYVSLESGDLILLEVEEGERLIAEGKVRAAHPVDLKNVASPSADLDTTVQENTEEKPAGDIFPSDSHEIPGGAPQESEGEKDETLNPSTPVESPEGEEAPKEEGAE